jgi:hypothetical protein
VVETMTRALASVAESSFAGATVELGCGHVEIGTHPMLSQAVSEFPIVCRLECRCLMLYSCFQSVITRDGEHVAEVVHVQAFVSTSVVKRLVVAISPRLV